jgi:hypothetical protein
LRSGIQSFHLAYARAKLPEGHAAGHVALPEGKEKAAARWAIFAWQVGQFFGKTLEIQVYLQRVSIFLEKVSHFRKIFFPLDFHYPK